MSYLPQPPQVTEPGYAYGVLRVKRGSRITQRVVARVDLATCEVAMVEYLSRDAYDLSENLLEFKPFGGKDAYIVIEGDDFEFEMDPADTANSGQAWARYQAKRLAAHVQKGPRARTPRMSRM